MRTSWCKSDRVQGHVLGGRSNNPKAMISTESVWSLRQGIITNLRERYDTMIGSLATVITNLISAIPWVGGDLVEFVTCILFKTYQILIIFNHHIQSYPIISYHIISYPSYGNIQPSYPILSNPIISYHSYHSYDNIQPSYPILSYIYIDQII